MERVDAGAYIYVRKYILKKFNFVCHKIKNMRYNISIDKQKGLLSRPTFLSRGLEALNADIS
jgi:hypothetical protein